MRIFRRRYIVSDFQPFLVNDWNCGWRDAGQMYQGALVSKGVGTILGQRKMILGVGGWDVREDHPCARLFTIGSSVSVDGACYLQQ